MYTILKIKIKIFQGYIEVQPDIFGGSEQEYLGLGYKLLNEQVLI